MADKKIELVSRVSVQEESFKEPESNNEANDIKSEESPRPRSFSDVIDTIENNGIQNAVRDFNYDFLSKVNVDKLGRDLLAVPPSKSSSGTRSKNAQQALRNLTPFYNQKFRVLQQKVDTWKAIRKPLLKKFESFIAQLDKRSKWCAAIRLLTSTADVTGSIGSILINPESDYTKHAFYAASFCGLFGVISTVVEVASTKKILDEVLTLIKEDYSSLESVLGWFQKNQELDSAVQDLFPHGIDKEIALQVQEEAEELEDDLKVFRSAFVSNVRKDYKLVEDKDFLYTLQLFCHSDIASLWWNRMIFRRQPIHMDLNRMILQMEFGQMQSLVYQSIPALPLEQQRLTSLPVAGRIMLNGLTIYDAISHLREGGKSVHSDKLKKLFSSMKKELKIIDGAIDRMKPVKYSRTSI